MIFQQMERDVAATRIYIGNRGQVPIRVATGGVGVFAEYRGSFELRIDADGEVEGLKKVLPLSSMAIAEVRPGEAVLVYQLQTDAESYKKRTRRITLLVSENVGRRYDVWSGEIVWTRPDSADESKK